MSLQQAQLWLLQFILSETSRGDSINLLNNSFLQMQEMIRNMGNAIPGQVVPTTARIKDTQGAASSCHQTSRTAAASYEHYYHVMFHNMLE
jgi:hypothetical protein